MPTAYIDNVKKCIELYPQKALLPGIRYTVKVDKNVRLSGSETIGEDIYAYFTVYGDFPNVSDVKIQHGQGNDGHNLYSVTHGGTAGKIIRNYHGA